MEVVLQALRDRGRGVEKKGWGWQCQCPAHGDGEASLSVTERDGKVLLRCHAGCASEAILAALALTWGDLFVDQGRGRSDRKEKAKARRPAATYKYRSADGKDLFFAARFPGKRFGQGRWTYNGWKIWGLKAGWHEVREGAWHWVGDDRDAPPTGGVEWFDGVTPVLFRLPQVLASAAAGGEVWVTEGEADTLALVKVGIEATTSPMGAGKWKPEYGESLVGCSLVSVWRDRDKAGYAHAADVARSLEALGVPFRVVESHPMGGKDADDHLKAGYSVSDVVVVEDWAAPFVAAEGPSPTPPSGSATTLHPPLTVVDGGVVRVVEAEQAWPGQSFALTDLGNAERFAASVQGRLVWCDQLGVWYQWTGSHWVQEQHGGAEVLALAGAVLRDMYREAAHMKGGDAAKALVEWAKKSEAGRRLQYAVDLAKGVAGIRVASGDLDQQPWSLACRNGTVDLRTGELRPADPRDLITQASPCDYDPEADCPRWVSFLDWLGKGDLASLAFLHRAAGYSLTGSTREQKVFFLWGTGGNGKSTFVRALMRSLGGAAMKATAETFLSQRQGAGIRSDIVRLREARLVVASETGRGRALDEDLVKDLTGGEPVTARPLYRPEITFVPQFKLWVTTNNRPTIRNVDEGIWRRVLLVPFTRRVTAAERDPGLDEKLERELPGILAWAVAGAVMWCREGLPVSSTISRATAEYREEMDVVGAFLSENTYQEEGVVTMGGELYKAYALWAKGRGDHAMSSRAFGETLKTKGMEWKRSSEGVGYVGLALVSRPLWGGGGS